MRRRRRRQRIHLEAKIARGLVQIRAGDALHDERPATELHAVGVERFFGGLEVGVLELVAQGDERVVGVVVDRVDRIRAVRRRILSLYAAGRLDLAFDRFHRRVEHLDIGDANRLDAEALRERPAGVVVRGFLRIVRGPILIIEQRVGDARVGLIHADDVAAGGEFFGFHLHRPRRRRLIFSSRLSCPSRLSRLCRAFRSRRSRLSCPSRPSRP